MARRREPNRRELEGELDPVQREALPAITHLQFLVLDLLRATTGGASASSLKAGIAAVSTEYGGPKFYQLMRRLVKSEMATSVSRTVKVAEEQIQRTYYRATPKGVDAHRITAEFYAIRRQIAASLDARERR